jgi:hypothetical protein
LSYVRKALQGSGAKQIKSRGYYHSACRWLGLDGRGRPSYMVFAYFIFYEERTIDNNVDSNAFSSSSTIDGSYETFAPCVSLAATYHF